MQAYRIGASSREKRKLKELQEHFAPLIAPYEARIAALEAKILGANTGVTTSAKRGPGRSPKEEIDL